MATLNYKHLHYFCVVDKVGGITRVSERSHLIPIPFRRRNKAATSEEATQYLRCNGI